MFHLSNSHLKIAKQRGLDLRNEAARQRAISKIRPGLRFQLAKTLQTLAHKIEPSLQPPKPPVVREC